MNANPLKQGGLTEHSAGLGTVTRKMVRERVIELAAINSRAAQDVSKSDWEQAKRELTGGPEPESTEARLESTPESERWDPVPGSAGLKAPTAPGEDEDDESRSDDQRLAEEGLAGAEHDQMRQAALNRSDTNQTSGSRPERRAN